MAGRRLGPALAVAGLLAGLLAAAPLAAPAAADPNRPLDVQELRHGDFVNDIVVFQQHCALVPPNSPPNCRDNLHFPDAFLSVAATNGDVGFGNTPLDCPPPCAADTAKGIWVFRVHTDDGEDLHRGVDTITISGPAGTVFSDEPSAYVMAEVDNDFGDNFDQFGNPFDFEHDPAIPSSVDLLADNKVQIDVAIDEVRSDELLYIWMADVTSPPAGTYSGFNFRVETSQQHAFPGWINDEVDFPADEAVRRNSTLAPDQQVVTVGQQVNVVATVRDRYGNPVPDVGVVIEPTSGSPGIVGSPDTTSDDDGNVRFAFTDHVAEDVVFQALAFDDGFFFPHTTTVRFQPGVPVAQYSEVVADPASAPADGVTPAVVEVRLADGFTNPNVGDELLLVPQPLPGEPTNVFTNGSVVAAPGSGCTAPVHNVPGVACARAVAESSTITDPSGAPVRQAIARFEVRSPHAERVRFTVNDLTRGAVLGEAAVVQFTPTAPATTSITPAQQSVAADGSASGSIAVDLRDAHDNAVPGIEVTLHQPDGSSATIDDAVATTGADGRATFTVRDAIVETVAFTATYRGTASGLPVSGSVPGAATVAFVPGATSPSASTMTAAPTSRLANGEAASTIVVTVVDAVGRPTPGVDVVVQGNTGHHSTITPAVLPTGVSGCAEPVPAGVADCNGQAAFTVTDETIETVTYTASVPSLGITVAETASVAFTAPPGIGTSAIAASPTTVPADGASTSTLTVTLRDAGGAALAGKDVCLTQSTGSTPADPPCDAPGPTVVTPVLIPTSASGCPTQAPAGTTDCTGRTRFRATSTAVGRVLYGVVDATDFPDLLLGPTAAVTFTAVPDEAGLSTVVADVALAVANGGASAEGTVGVLVTLRDGAGAVLPGHGVELRQGATTSATVTAVAIPTSVSGCPVPVPAGITDCNGQARFEATDAVPEAVTLRAVDTTTGVTVAQRAPVTFLPDEAAVSTVVANPDQVLAGSGTATVTVVLDPGSTPLVGHDVILLQSAGGHASRVAAQVPKESSGCALQAPAGTTDCTGTAAFVVSDDVVETVTFSAFDLTSGTRIDQTATVRFVAPPPVVTSLSPASGPPAGGTAVTVTGSNFATQPGATTVTFGSAAATEVTCSSSTSCVATAPPGAPGTVPVVVTTASGSSPAVPYAYVLAVPAVTSVAPASGPPAGGTLVTVTGTDLAGATSVSFGTASVAVQSVDAAGTQVTAIAPASLPGTVDVRVTTPGGTSPTGSQARYTYANPPPADRCAGKTGLALLLCRLGL